MKWETAFWHQLPAGARSTEREVMNTEDELFHFTNSHRAEELSTHLETATRYLEFYITSHGLVVLQ